MKIRAAILLLVLLIPSSEGMTTALSEKSEYLASKFWHTTLSAVLHLNNKQFKLTQGAQTIGDDSYWLWSVFNSTTLFDDGYWYEPSQHSSFTSSYNLLLYHAKIQVNEDSCNLNKAMLKYNNAQNCYAWNKTYDNLVYELSTAKPMTITADTSFVERCAGEMVNKRIQIKANFDHIVVFTSYPLSQTDTLNSELKSYSAWFTPCFLMKAYQNIDDKVLSPENWNCAFNSTGYLTGITKALVVIDKGSIVFTVSYNAVQTISLTKITSPCMLGVLIYDLNDYTR